MDHVLDHAARIGLHVVLRDLGRRSGEVHSSGVVFVNPRKSHLTQRVTLAHECGHWVLGHDHRRAHDHAADERAADLYAARMLISPTEYALAERIYGCDPRALAGPLGVTPELVHLWQQHRDACGRAQRMTG